MAKIKYLILLSSFFLFVSCSGDIGYLWSVTQGQWDLLSRRVPIKKALQKYDLSEEDKKKLQLVAEIKAFALNKLEMNINNSIYTDYVHLNRPYVTYLLRVSLAYELKAHTWRFPMIGSVPYKGFFSKKELEAAAEAFPPDKYDIYTRGVRAYSTLGWLDDPILSSMLRYEETDFVVMIFHELAHTVLFFKNHVDFNERFAEFLGRRAAILFYLEKEGERSETVKRIRQKWEDEILFSSFLAKEYNVLNQWYKQNRGKITPEIKYKRIKEIQNRFAQTIQPKLKTDRYDYFQDLKLNNAFLLSYRSYNYNMKEFNQLFSSSAVKSNVKTFINYCAQFEGEADPEAALRKTIN